MRPAPSKRQPRAGIYRCLWLAALAGLPAVIMAAESAGSVQRPEDLACLRCHGMATLSYQDEETGRIVDLSVDPEHYRHSNHARLSCRYCHGNRYQDYPHPRPAPALTCLSCHQDDPKFDRYHFQRKEQQFRKSVHYLQHKDSFTCFACHDPHAFRLAGDQPSTSEVILQDNGMCLACHGSNKALASLTSRSFPALQVIHSWLPQPVTHWRAVRCIECHTPPAEQVSHVILDASKAERHCVSCHTRDSSLLDKLYKHRVQEERQKNIGFVDAVARNEAYIIGMTRSRSLDRMSFILLGLTLMGLLGHAAGRWWAGRQRRIRHES